MTEILEPRIRRWLESGPSRLPAGAIDLVIDSIGTVPQKRRVLPRLPWTTSWSRPRLAVTAAAVAVTVGLGGFALLRTDLPDVAGLPAPRELLQDLNGVTPVLERYGQPSTDEDRIELGRLDRQTGFILAAACTGDGALMAVGVYWPPQAQAVPENGPSPTEPHAVHRLLVACDGSIHRLPISMGQFAVQEDGYPVIVIVPAGVTWSAAVGEVTALAETPDFPPFELTPGFHLLEENRCLGCGPVLVSKSEREDSGFAALPRGATQVNVLVQCTGDPIMIDPHGPGVDTSVACGDVVATTRITLPAAGYAGVAIWSDGISWVNLRSEADGSLAGEWPAAPPMPTELADVWFAEGLGGPRLALGRLGSSDQSLVTLGSLHAGQVGSDLVAVILGGATARQAIDLWSISEARSVRRLVDGPAGVVGQTWVDATNRQVLYVMRKPDFSTEVRRVGMDGSGDRLIVASPPDGSGGWFNVGLALALDDSLFVVDGCPIDGPCVRTVYETATGAVRSFELQGDATCALVGVVDGQVVARTAPTCDSSEEQHLSVQALEGGERRALVSVGNGGDVEAVVIDGTAGPWVVYRIYGNDEGELTRYVAAPLAGGESREILAVDAGRGMPPELSGFRLPLPGWVLIGGPLADGLFGINPRLAPQLINVETGEVIKLVNLPHERDD
jgi:hypothetical protein